MAHPLAVQLAREVVELEPFRETGWQALMRAYAGGGNRAQALRAYEACRKLLADELRVAPSPETDAIAHALKDSPAIAAADPARRAGRRRSG